MPGYQVFALVILTVHHSATLGATILVHICRAHENRDLQSFLLEIFFVKCLFNHHHFTIGRSNHEVLTLHKVPAGNTKERYEEQEDTKGKNENNDRNNGISCTQETERKQVCDQK